MQFSIISNSIVGSAPQTVDRLKYKTGQHLGLHTYGDVCNGSIKKP